MLSAAPMRSGMVVSNLLLPIRKLLPCTFCSLFSKQKIYNRSKFLLKYVAALAIVLTTSKTQAQQKNLDYFLEQGVQNSPLIKEANNNILINRIDSLRILAAYKIQVNGISNNAYAPVIHGYGYDEIITNIRNFSEQVNATKNFIGKRNLQIHFNGITLLSDSLSLAGKIKEQDLRRTIIAAYIAAYGSWRQYNFNNEVYRLLSSEDTILKKLTQASV